MQAFYCLQRFQKDQFQTYVLKTLNLQPQIFLRVLRHGGRHNSSTTILAASQHSKHGGVNNSVWSEKLEGCPEKGAHLPKPPVVPRSADYLHYVEYVNATLDYIYLCSGRFITFFLPVNTSTHPICKCSGVFEEILLGKIEVNCFPACLDLWLHQRNQICPERSINASIPPSEAAPFSDAQFPASRLQAPRVFQNLFLKEHGTLTCTSSNPPVSPCTLPQNTLPTRTR